MSFHIKKIISIFQNLLAQILLPALSKGWCDIGCLSVLRHLIHSLRLFKEQFGNHFCQLPQHLWLHPVRAH